MDSNKNNLLSSIDDLLNDYIQFTHENGSKIKLYTNEASKALSFLFQNEVHKAVLENKYEMLNKLERSVLMVDIAAFDKSGKCLITPYVIDRFKELM